MEGYDVLLFLHVYSVVAWVGGGALLNLLGTRLSRAGTPQQLADFGAQVEWVGRRVFTPLSVLALAVGILMALDDRWDFGAMWIQLGLGGSVLSFLLGTGFLGPQSGKLGRLVRDHGPDHPEVRPRLTRLPMVARLDALLLATHRRRHDAQAGRVASSSATLPPRTGRDHPAPEDSDPRGGQRASPPSL